MGKVGVRKICMMIPYDDNEDEITKCFDYGIDMAYVFCTKKQKPKATDFANRIKDKYKLKKSIVKPIDGKDFLEKSGKAFKVAATQAKNRKQIVQFILTRGELSGVLVYVKYLLNNTRLIAYDNKIITIPVFSPEIDGTFEERVKALGNSSEISGTAGSGNVYVSESFIEEIKEASKAASKSPIICDNGSCLVGAYYANSSQACYLAEGKALKLPLKKPKLDLAFPKDKAKIIGGIDGTINDPLNTLSGKTGIDSNKIGRFLKSIVDDGMITVDGVSDTVEISELGQLFLA